MQKTIEKSAKRRVKARTNNGSDMNSSRLISRILSISGLPISFLAEKVFEVTPKTLSKYRNENVSLSALMLEHTRKFLDVYELGIEVFGSSGEFNGWLMQDSFGLGREIPADKLNTSLGLELVYDELIRIAYGATA